MIADRALSMLGIAMKAGKVASGEYQTEHAIKSGKAKLVIIAEDASDNTKKMFESMCAHYGVRQICYGSKESLGHNIGKEFRASLAVTDRGLAQAILQKMAQPQAE